jgi:hypothetical protein
VPRPISKDELKQLLSEEPATTQTYEIDAQERLETPSNPRRPLRKMDNAEVAELAHYLGVGAGLLVGPFEVSDVACQRCGRHTTFLDFAKSSVDAGAHSRSELAAILTSRDRAWLTIVGRDGGRKASCAECGSRLSLQDNSYRSGAYDYSFPGH